MTPPPIRPRSPCLLDSAAAYRLPCVHTSLTRGAAPLRPLADSSLQRAHATGRVASAMEGSLVQRNSFWFLAAAALLNCNAASAGCPWPETSTVEVGGQDISCQFRFRADGGMDVMTVSGTIRWADWPLANCPATISLVPDAGTLALSNCDALARSGSTNANGVFEASFSRISGRGTVEVVLFAGCCGYYEVARTTVTFTSPDLDANGTVNVVDLGLWASGLPPGYLQASDYDCNQAVNVVDLGLWAGGLGLGCGAGANR